LIGITAFLDRSAPTPPVTIVEAAPDGWWYSAILPRGRLVATYLTDADDWVAGPGSPRERWSRALAATRHTRLRATSPPERVAVFPAFSSVLVHARVPDWVAVGDAALSVDPLSGQGMRHALTSALTAAAAIEAQLSGSRSALARHDQDRAQAFSHYLTARSEHYGSETRWPGQPFWNRRRTAVTAGRSRRSSG
jgi:2-polyprenyl-6-methoxyphenol hydroxylase-like FAD-dependent oxidoreductase